MGAGALCFLLIAGDTLVNGLSYFAGLGYEADLHVTDSIESHRWRGANTVSGTYPLDGATHVVDHARWLTLEPLPEEGDVVEVMIGPIWPNPIMVESSGALFQLITALAAALPG